MKAHALTAKALNTFTNRHFQADRKGKAMKRLIAAMALVAIGLGMSTSAYPFFVANANSYQEWRFVGPDNINYISYKNGVTSLMLKGMNNACAASARNISVPQSDPDHDRITTILQLAQLTERKLNIWVICDGASGRFGSIEME